METRLGPCVGYESRNALLEATVVPREVVDLFDDVGERTWCPSTLYRKDRWDEPIETISADELKNMEVKYEKRLNKDTNKMEDWVRVFDQKDGIMKSELYEDSRVSHRTRVDDGLLQLDAGQTANNYKQLRNEMLDSRKHRRGLCDQQVQEALKTKGTCRTASSSSRHTSLLQHGY